MSIQITGGQMPISGGTLTGPLAIAIGSAAAPGMAVAGDANTGLWAPAADTLAVSTAGVEAIRVTSAQFVGIGTASPSVPFEVQKTNAGAQESTLARFRTERSDIANADKYLDIFVSTNDIPVVGLDAYKEGGDTPRFDIRVGLVTRLTIGTSGNVGIGTISPTAALHVPASSTARASLRIPAGTAPTIPNAGDVWVEGTVIKFFDGTTTKEIAFV